MIPTYLAVHLAATALLITPADARHRHSPVWRDRVTKEVDGRLRAAWRPRGKWEHAAGPRRVTPGATGTVAGSPRVKSRGPMQDGHAGPVAFRAPLIEGGWTVTQD